MIIIIMHKNPRVRTQLEFFSASIENDYYSITRLPILKFKYVAFGNMRGYISMVKKEDSQILQ